MKIVNFLSTKMGVKFTTMLVSNRFFRKIAANVIDKNTHKRLMKSKDDKMPQKMIEDKQQIVHNITKVVDRWVGSGNTSRKIFKNFLTGFAKAFSGNEAVKKKFRMTYGFNPPSFLTISPTKKCNLKCKGCYASSSAASAEILDFDVVDRIVREQKELWASHFTVISGGEPFLYRSHGKGILDLAERHPDTFFLVYTNGTLITKEVAHRIAELGNITPAISVEGFQEETDDRRGKGVHRKILNTFKNLREEGVLFGLSVTATKFNSELILSSEFIDYYVDKLGAYYIWIFQYMPIGRSFSLDLMVSPEQRVEMLRKTRKWMYQRELFIADFWNSAMLSNGCIAAGRHEGGGYIYIDWSGNVMPCVFNPYSQDNILLKYKSGGNLNDILMSPIMRGIREWQKAYINNSKPERYGNMLIPCPIRDHHKDMREIIEQSKANPVDEPAKHALEDKEYYRGMCLYDERISDITDRIWEKEFLRGKKHPDEKEENLVSKIRGII